MKKNKILLIFASLISLSVFTGCMQTLQTSTKIYYDGAGATYPGRVFVHEPTPAGIQNNIDAEMNAFGKSLYEGGYPEYATPVELSSERILAMMKRMNAENGSMVWNEEDMQIMAPEISKALAITSKYGMVHFQGKKAGSTGKQFMSILNAATHGNAFIEQEKRDSLSVSPTEYDAPPVRGTVHVLKPNYQYYELTIGAGQANGIFATRHVDAKPVPVRQRPTLVWAFTNTADYAKHQEELVFEIPAY